MIESKEQSALFKVAQYNTITRDYLHAIPNDGKRDPRTGANFKRRGLKAGVPDICLPYPCNGYHGLYIELKRSDKSKSRVTPEQKQWIEKLSKVGYAAHVAYGWQDAWNIITNYLSQ